MPAQCATCARSDAGVNRCSDCSGDRVLCNDCCVAEHINMPFHVIKVCSLKYGRMLYSRISQAWNGQFFSRTSLYQLGLVVQLGHGSGSACAFAVHGPCDFMVLHTNGWHQVAIRYCQCNQASVAGTRIQQLLRFELFPASLEDPTTCASFRMLETYHALTLQSKVAIYDYYLTLNNLTDNSGTSITWVSASVRAAPSRTHLRISGSAETSAADGARVASSQGAEAGWKRLRRGRCGDNNGRRVESAVPCMSPPWRKSARRLARRP